MSAAFKPSLMQTITEITPGETSKRKTAILLNPGASHGRAESKWTPIEEEVRRQLADTASEILLIKAGDPQYPVEFLIASGYSMLIAAGGDGSVHFLLQEMMQHYRPELILGAIGLGSSNDFHKPFGYTLRGIPLRIDPRLARMQDVGCIQYTDEAGTRQKRYFLINASIGVTANANWLFNHPDSLLRVLKGRFVSLAIFYAAVKTILRHQNFTLQIKADQFCSFGRFANVAILKNVHVSGAFQYDQHLGYDDGLLGLNICAAMSHFQLLRVLSDLSHAVFSGKPGRTAEYVRQVQIDTLGQLLALELDGEVVQAYDIHCSVLPGALAVIQSGSPAAGLNP
jgi:diacylglycerol kinase (ATP)